MTRKIYNRKHGLQTDAALLFLRLAVGVWMLSKGLPKVNMLFSEHVEFYAVLGMSAKLSLVLTVFAQVVGSVLLIVGFVSRFAAGTLAINMLVAVLAVHISDPFSKAEPALHFLLVYIILILAGAGKFSFDYLIERKKSSPDENSKQQY